MISIDVFALLARRLLLNPVLSVPLLAATALTKEGRQLAAERPRQLNALRVLAGVALARWANGLMNRGALNNWTRDKRGYDWPGGHEIVVITGGADGMGGRLAQRLAVRGAKVAALDLKPPKMYSTGKHGLGEIEYFECDVTNPDQVHAVCKAVREHFGAPTVLVNNAGILPGWTIFGSTDAQTRRVFDVNTVSHYWLARELVPSMAAANHGMVVTIASQAGFITLPGLTDYAASKAAAISFHEGLSAELRIRYNAPAVRTVLVCPGFVGTGLIDHIHARGGSRDFFNPLLQPDYVVDLLSHQILSGRSGNIMIPLVSSGLFGRSFRVLPYWLQVLTQNIVEKLTRTV